MKRLSARHALRAPALERGSLAGREDARDHVERNGPLGAAVRLVLVAVDRRGNAHPAEDQGPHRPACCPSVEPDCRPGSSRRQNCGSGPAPPAGRPAFVPPGCARHHAVIRPFQHLDRNRAAMMAKPVIVCVCAGRLFCMGLTKTDLFLSISSGPCLGSGSNVRTELETTDPFPGTPFTGLTRLAPASHAWSSSERLGPQDGRGTRTSAGVARSRSEPRHATTGEPSIAAGASADIPSEGPCGLHPGRLPPARVQDVLDRQRAEREHHVPRGALGRDVCTSIT